MASFDLGLQQASQENLEQARIKQEQRLQAQNNIGAQLLDAINQSSSIKPTMKDDQGNVVANPAYEKAQDDRRKLLTQYTSLYSPEQHASFSDRLHGLIFGHPTPHHQQPALSPNSSPNAPMPDPNAPAAAAPPAAPAPLHPMASAPPDHPLHAITSGIKGLGEHLKAFAHPLQEPAKVDPDLVAKYYKDPAEVAHERNMELWGEKGQNALAVAQERTKALMASLNARRPALLSETTIPSLLKEMEIDPTVQIYGPSGNQLSPAQLSEMPPDLVAREWKAGSQVFYALGNKNSKTLNVNGQIYDIPALGAINIAGPNANSSVVGQATSTLPKSSSTTDPFGLTQTSTHTTQLPTPAAAPPAAPTGPVLKTRPGSPDLSSVNASIAAANAASPKLNKGKPVSTTALAVPTGSASLDADGHIPAGVGNDLVRQFANNILDGRDPKEIPNPKAQAAALALVDKFVPGYSRGAFTPKEKIQFKVATDFLEQLKNSPSLSVLDSFVSREKIAHAMKAPEHMNIFDRIMAYNLDPKEAEFVRLVNAARGTVAGLSQITRSGRATNNQVQTIATELPNIFQSSSAKDAKDRVDQLLKEANIALTTNPMSIGKGGPVSKSAPSSAPPKVGDTKTFPNGKKGKWDGTGWVAE